MALAAGMKAVDVVFYRAKMSSVLKRGLGVWPATWQKDARLITISRAEIRIMMEKVTPGRCPDWTLTRTAPLHFH